jgi:hypothetical protein
MVVVAAAGAILVLAGQQVRRELRVPLVETELAAAGEGAGGLKL